MSSTPATKSRRYSMKDVPRSQIDFIVGNFHVGTPDEEVAADIRKRSESAGWPKPVVTLAVNYAVKRHQSNRGTYSDVMSGNIGRKRRMSREDGHASGSGPIDWSYTHMPPTVAVYCDVVKRALVERHGFTAAKADALLARPKTKTWVRASFRAGHWPGLMAFDLSKASSGRSGYASGRGPSVPDAKAWERVLSSHAERVRKLELAYADEFLGGKDKITPEVTASIDEAIAGEPEEDGSFTPLEERYADSDKEGRLLKAIVKARAHLAQAIIESRQGRLFPKGSRRDPMSGALLDPEDVARRDAKYQQGVETFRRGMSAQISAREAEETRVHRFMRSAENMLQSASKLNVMSWDREGGGGLKWRGEAHSLRDWARLFARDPALFDKLQREVSAARSAWEAEMQASTKASESAARKQKAAASRQELPKGYSVEKARGGYAFIGPDGRANKGYKTIGEAKTAAAHHAAQSKGKSSGRRGYSASRQKLTYTPDPYLHAPDTTRDAPDTERSPEPSFGRPMRHKLTYTPNPHPQHAPPVRQKLVYTPPGYSRGSTGDGLYVVQAISGGRVVMSDSFDKRKDADATAREWLAFRGAEYTSVRIITRDGDLVSNHRVGDKRRKGLAAGAADAVPPAFIKLLKNLNRLGGARGEANCRAMGVSIKTVRAAADEGLVYLLDFDTRARITPEGRKVLADLPSAD